mmetsp:Transcript_130167/g.243522  ORF Transcript_130167/g.243522 Transcript_130167/m.243522 type:complete len:380 (+) Transcript_130167:1655-2794(+)
MRRGTAIHPQAHWISVELRSAFQLRTLARSCLQDARLVQTTEDPARLHLLLHQHDDLLLATLNHSRGCCCGAARQHRQRRPRAGRAKARCMPGLGVRGPEGKFHLELTLSIHLMHQQVPAPEGFRLGISDPLLPTQMQVGKVAHLENAGEEEYLCAHPPPCAFAPPLLLLAFCVLSPPPLFASAQPLLLLFVHGGLLQLLSADALQLLAACVQPPQPLCAVALPLPCVSFQLPPTLCACAPAPAAQPPSAAFPTQPPCDCAPFPLLPCASFQLPARLECAPLQRAVASLPLLPCAVALPYASLARRCFSVLPPTPPHGCAPPLGDASARPLPCAHRSRLRFLHLRRLQTQGEALPTHWKINPAWPQMWPQLRPLLPTPS